MLSIFFKKEFMNKKRFATVIRLYAFFFFITLECLLPIKSTAQKTTTEKGPFEPFGGKREITFNKDNVPIELKKYDTKDNIRKHTVINRDNQNRIIFMADSVFDEEKHFTKGSYKTVTYKNDLDYGGKTIYNQYNPKTKKFVIVRPLVST